VSWLQKLGVVAIFGALAVGLTGVSVSAHTTTPKAAVTSLTIQTPQGPVTLKDTGGTIIGPQEVCNGNGYCGSQYADWTGYLSISYEDSPKEYQDTPTAVDGVLGCLEGAVGYSFVTLIPGVGDATWGYVVLSCLTGGIGRAIWP
jgi:hypothetical protein